MKKMSYQVRYEERENGRMTCANTNTQDLFESYDAAVLEAFNRTSKQGFPIGCFDTDEHNKYNAKRILVELRNKAKKAERGLTVCATFRPSDQRGIHCVVIAPVISEIQVNGLTYRLSNEEVR